MAPGRIYVTNTRVTHEFACIKTTNRAGASRDRPFENHTPLLGYAQALGTPMDERTRGMAGGSVRACSPSYTAGSKYVSAIVVSRSCCCLTESPNPLQL